MVAETAFQRLEAGPMQLAQVILEEAAPLAGIQVQGKAALASLKCGRKHTKRPVRRHL
jgi:hypothetical protein